MVHMFALNLKLMGMQMAIWAKDLRALFLVVQCIFKCYGILHISSQCIEVFCLFIDYPFHFENEQHGATDNQPILLFIAVE